MASRQCEFTGGQQVTVQGRVHHFLTDVDSSGRMIIWLKADPSKTKCFWPKAIEYVYIYMSRIHVSYIYILSCIYIYYHVYIYISYIFHIIPHPIFSLLIRIECAILISRFVLKKKHMERSGRHRGTLIERVPKTDLEGHAKSWARRTWEHAQMIR